VIICIIRARNRVLDLSFGVTNRIRSVSIEQEDQDCEHSTAGYYGQEEIFRLTFMNYKNCAMKGMQSDCCSCRCSTSMSVVF